MKTLQLLTVGLLAVTGLLATQPSSKAAVSTNQGDLILAFRTNDASVAFDLEIDLGLASTFTTWALNNPGNTISLNLGGSYFGAAGGLAASDLVAVYGANWNSNTGLVFSVAGADASKNLYASFFAGIAPVRKPTGTQTLPAGKLDTMRSTINGAANVFDNGTTVVNLSSPQATVLGSGDNGSYSTTIGNVKDYNYFDNSTEGSVVSSGTSSLNFWKLAPGQTGLPGQNLGAFNLDSTGLLTFTAAPEPGSVALLGVSAMTLLFRRRRAVQV